MNYKSVIIRLIMSTGFLFVTMIKPVIAQDAPTPQPKAGEETSNKDSSKATVSTPDTTKAAKPLSPKEIEARKRVERIKAEKRAKLEKDKSDPNYEKRLENLKRQARIKFLEKKLREEKKLLEQNRITILGGRLKTKPTVTPAKETTKAPEGKAPAAAPVPAPAPAPIKPGSVTNQKPIIQLLSDETELYDEKDTLEPLDLLDQAEAEVQDARDKLLQGIESGASDEDLSMLLEEEARASGVYMEVLELTKEFYSQIQAAITADPSLAEGIDLSVIPELLADIDQAIKDEQALSSGDDATETVPEDQG